MVSIVIKIAVGAYFIPVSLQLLFAFVVFRLVNYLIKNHKNIDKIQIRNKEDCELFCIEPDATDEVIKDKYKKLALLHHPDKHGGNTEEMAKINSAKDRLLGITKLNTLDELFNESKKETQYYKNICMHGWYKIYPMIYEWFCKPLINKFK